jgi:hypothetical protein
VVYPSVEQIRDYTGSDDLLESWTDEQILSALITEAADQESRCVITDPLPAPLADALCVRVVVNLSQRNHLMPTDMMGDAGVSLAPIYKHPVITRLEAPYRRVFFA